MYEQSNCLSYISSDLEPLPAERHPSQQKEPDQRLREPGTNDGGSTAPRSTEGSFSEDVFTETELSPIREEEQASNEDLRLDKSSGASTESVQTITQVEAASSQTTGSARGSVSQPDEPAVVKEDNPPETATENDSQSPMGSKQNSVEKPPSTPTTTTTSSSTSQAQDPSSSSTSRPGSQSSATTGATDTTSVSAGPPVDVNQGTDPSQTDTMQQGKEEKENAEQTQKDGVQNSAEGKHTR